VKAVAGLLLLLSAGALGVYAGAMLTEGFVLVPHWQSLPPADFYAWYAANDARLVGFFGAVTEMAALLALGAALAAFITRHPGRWSALVAALSILVCVAMFFVYFADANARFSAASIPADALPAELERWASWHRTRMALTVVALLAALIPLRRRG
jgi:hypothetical protein